MNNSSNINSITSSIGSLAISDSVNSTLTNQQSNFVDLLNTNSMQDNDPQNDNQTSSVDIFIGARVMR